ncbi:MAG: TIGR00268 family protein, partial [Spirochaetota bacterium]|nr:TIGR00268 family protein [Spirochaetota bacterium]
RQLSKKLLLPTWDKQEFACLSSRLPVGTQITLESLSQIEQGEQILYELGFKVFRLRYYQNIARIELSEDDMYKIIKKEYRQIIIKKLTQIGFKYITLDLVGYQKGNTSIANN